MYKRFPGRRPGALSQLTLALRALCRARLFGLALVVLIVTAAPAWPLEPPALASFDRAGAGRPPAFLPSAAPVREYQIQGGTPAGIRNFLQPELGCAWAGIGGQVFDLSGTPVSGMLVKVSGVYQGQPISKVAVTNASQGFGPGGYDITLGTLPQAARLSLQLVDVTGKPRSDSFLVGTFPDCQRSLLVVNLRERLVAVRMYLPLVSRR